MSCACVVFFQFVDDEEADNDVVGIEDDDEDKVAAFLFFPLLFDDDEEDVTEESSVINFTPPIRPPDSFKQKLHTKISRLNLAACCSSFVGSLSGRVNPTQEA